MRRAGSLTRLAAVGCAVLLFSALAGAPAAAHPRAHRHAHRHGHKHARRHGRKHKRRHHEHKRRHHKHQTLAFPRFADGDGLHVVSQRELDARLLALTVTTAALPKPANVRVLLPAGYGSRPRRHYPVLYLLHGTSGGAADWTTLGGAEQTTAGLPLIVVMPDIALGDDGGGWCTDWPDGMEKWETFHIDELIPWVDRNLRTAATRAGRAIAGLSQGGFCSMSYAARHPDLFETALSFSGAPDIAYDPAAQLEVRPVIEATEVGLDGVAPFTFFGNPLSDELNWAAHDPTTLANNLRGMNLFMYAGNGFPGPLDKGLNPGASVIEGGAEQLTTMFHKRLVALGIPSTYDMYGNGTHVWPYWARDLRWSIGPIMAGFAHPAPTPDPVTYTAADPSYSVFGWQVSIRRSVGEFSTLSNASSTGFKLAGSGSATVVTPAFYRPHTEYDITVGAQTFVDAADGRGQLHILVPLGPSNTQQQDTPGAQTKVYTTTVSIPPPPR
jgi:S-formylglutathione hydrolase FrmB